MLVFGCVFVLCLFCWLCLLLCFQIMIKALFSLQFWCFYVMLFQWLLLLFFVFVLLFVSLFNEIGMFYVCCVFLSKHLDIVICFFVVFVFSSLARNKSNKNTHGKNQKKAKCKKINKNKQNKTKQIVFQLAQMFTNIVPDLLGRVLMYFCWERYKLMVSAKKETKKKPLCKRSISGPSMLRNVIGPDIDPTCGSIF